MENFSSYICNMLNIMFNIDFKDRKIIYELDWNSRAPLSEIGRRVRLSKPVVKYRIDRLYENGIIRNFHTVINTGLLGYKPIRFNFTYQYKTPEIENNIIKYFMTNKNVWRIISIKGRYDLEDKGSAFSHVFSTEKSTSILAKIMLYNSTITIIFRHKFQWYFRRIN